MKHDDRPYLEIRITLIHIVIMIVAVILLGFLLTYLGYKAGKASLHEQNASVATIQEFPPQAQEMTVPVDSPLTEVTESLPTGDQATTQPDTQAAVDQTKDTSKPSDSSFSAIEEELRLHKSANNPQTPQSQQETPPKNISPKPVTDKVYFSIQVGAFSSFQNAKTYAAHFNELGYKTEIVSGEGAGGTLYRLWVGQYSDRNQGMQEKSKLEKKENKKFSLVSNR